VETFVTLNSQSAFLIPEVALSIMIVDLDIIVFKGHVLLEFLVVRILPVLLESIVMRKIFACITIMFVRPIRIVHQGIIAVLLEHVH
jgi:hypothetical protein